MILITGATGHYGATAINSLLQKGIKSRQISALVRNLEKSEDLRNKGVNIKLGDYSGYESLVAAFEGTETLLFISGTEISTRLKQHENVVRAAKKAGIQHIPIGAFGTFPFTDRKNDKGKRP